MASEIGRRIKALREERNLSQNQLAKRAGISQAGLSAIESTTKNPSMQTLTLLASALGVSTAYLTGDIPSSSTDLFSIPGIEPLPKTKKVPRLGTIACGDPILAMENIEEYDQAPDNIHCDFTLVCKGDSMTGARILDGDIVYIRMQPDVEDGEIAAVLIGDEATLKRVRRANGQLILWPENPAYSPMVFSGPQLADVRILGKAVAFLSRVR